MTATLLGAHSDLRSEHSRVLIRGLGIGLALLVAAVAAFLPAHQGQAAATLPPGFQERVVFSGLDHPTALRFSPDGRVFVAEVSGLIRVFASLSATTPTTFADLRTNVHNYWERGLLGMALDPNFLTNPYVYVLYTYDAAIGGTAPRWGSVGGTLDGCPTPPGPMTDGCVVSGRLSRLPAAGTAMSGPEQVLIEDWCQQFPSHSVGSLVFGPDGALYVSAGEGANLDYVDYGQFGNPCGDPPAEGGALRSQSLRRPSGEPISLDGTILRVDPATGVARADNPLAGNSNANARRIIAYGLRNPFRITTRPGTSEIWIGDVGWGDSEEIDRITTPTSSVQNFGWPCYEGDGPQPGYKGANLTICDSLYSQPGAVTSPFFTYHHTAQIVPGETCPTGLSSITGLAFGVYSGNPYPADYDGALFFADYSRNCIWAMKTANGLPTPSRLETFVAGAAGPVELTIGPDRNLYYVDHQGGTIRRIEYVGTKQPPTSSSISSNFNGTPIPAGATIWFNSVGSVKGAVDGTQITISGAQAVSTANGETYTVQMPNSAIIFSASATQATTTFNGVAWVTTVPLRSSGNVFLSGAPFTVPAGGLPGGINPVVWSWDMWSTTPGVCLSWKWAAAAYTQFTTDLNGIGVKPINGGQMNPYNNSDHAGTPENFKSFVTGGARGGGGSNFTGAYSRTASVMCR